MLLLSDACSDKPEFKPCPEVFCALSVAINWLVLSNTCSRTSGMPRWGAGLACSRRCITTGKPVKLRQSCLVDCPECTMLAALLCSRQAALLQSRRASSDIKLALLSAGRGWRSS